MFTPNQTPATQESNSSSHHHPSLHTNYSVQPKSNYTTTNEGGGPSTPASVSVSPPSDETSVVSSKELSVSPPSLPTAPTRRLRPFAVPLPFLLPRCRRCRCCCLLFLLLLRLLLVCFRRRGDPNGSSDSAPPSAAAPPSSSSLSPSCPPFTFRLPFPFPLPFPLPFLPRRLRRTLCLRLEGSSSCVEVEKPPVEARPDPSVSLKVLVRTSVSAPAPPLAPAPAAPEAVKAVTPISPARGLRCLLLARPAGLLVNKSGSKDPRPSCGKYAAAALASAAVRALPFPAACHGTAAALPSEGRCWFSRCSRCGDALAAAASACSCSCSCSTPCCGATWCDSTPRTGGGRPGA